MLTDKQLEAFTVIRTCFCFLFKLLTLQHDPGISVKGLSYPNWSYKFYTVQMF